MPTKISSTCWSRMISRNRLRNSAKGSARMNSSGWAITPSSSLMAMPIRFVPWSMARMRIALNYWSEIFHCLHRRTYRPVDALLRVRRGNEAGLKLRWRQVNPSGQHAVKEPLKPLAVALHCVGQVVHRPVSKIGAEHRAAPIEPHRHLRRGGGLFHSRFELRPELFELRVGGGGFLRESGGFRAPRSALRT